MKPKRQRLRAQQRGLRSERGLAAADGARACERFEAISRPFGVKRRAIGAAANVGRHPKPGASVEAEICIDSKAQAPRRFEIAHGKPRLAGAALTFHTCYMCDGLRRQDS